MPGETLVDIGCGDGTLMRLAIGHGVDNAIGTSYSADEAALRALGLNVAHAYSHSLPIPDHCASVVVCN